TPEEVWPIGCRVNQWLHQPRIDKTGEEDVPYPPGAPARRIEVKIARIHAIFTSLPEGRLLALEDRLGGDQLLGDPLGGGAPVGTAGLHAAAGIQPLQGLRPEGGMGGGKVLHRGP